MENFVTISGDFSQQAEEACDLIQSALTQGLNDYDVYCESGVSTSGKTADIFAVLNLYINKIIAEDYLSDPESFFVEQKNIYQQIYSSENTFTVEMRLFLEFMLGLCRFAISMQVFIKYVKYLHVHYLGIVSALMQVNDAPGYSCQHCKCDNVFWSYLHSLAQYGKVTTHEVLRATNNFSLIDFWVSAKQFFIDMPNYEKLAKYLVSMQYVPEDRAMLGLAQMLHWGGFGGSGELLEKHGQLAPLLDHRIGYHAKNDGGFNNLFGVILQQLHDLRKCMTVVGTSLLQRVGRKDEVLKILDIGSGPAYLGVSEVVDNLVAAGKKVELTVSEVDTASLMELKSCKGKGGSPIVDVRYFDLNFIKEISVDHVVVDVFDAVTVSLVLHQLSIPKITEALQYFVRIVKPRGYIFNADVSAGNYYQTLLVPVNCVDREGKVPSLANYSFSQTAVKISNEHAKIAYPLLSKCQYFPSARQALYVFNVYQIYVVPNDSIAHLDVLWHQQKFAQVDALIKSG